MLTKRIPLHQLFLEQIVSVHVEASSLHDEKVIGPIPLLKYCLPVYELVELHLAEDLGS
jgi:hypothetical protein